MRTEPSTPCRLPVAVHGNRVYEGSRRHVYEDEVEAEVVRHVERLRAAVEGNALRRMADGDRLDEGRPQRVGDVEYGNILAALVRHEGPSDRSVSGDSGGTAADVQSRGHGVGRTVYRAHG